MASRRRRSLIIGVGSAAGVAAVAVAARGRVAALVRRVPRRGEAAPADGVIDIVEEASRQSFPASDPPGYGPGV